MIPSERALALLAELREELGSDVVVITGVDEFFAGLKKGLEEYRKGGEENERKGCIRQLGALAILAGTVMSARGASAVTQVEALAPMGEVRQALISLNDGVQRPRLFRPLPAKGRPSSTELREHVWRTHLAAAYQLWCTAHRGSDKEEEVLANEVATKFGNNVRGASIREYRRTVIAKNCERPFLAGQYQLLLRLASEHFPGDPAAAAEALIASAKKQLRKP